MSGELFEALNLQLESDLNVDQNFVFYKRAYGRIPPRESVPTYFCCFELKREPAPEISSMGIIKDGSISGNLPSSSQAFAVNYPGYPSSIERAVETLGGTQGIVKVRTQQSNKLELYFRPGDPYSHPAFGELRSCNNFLLKISKKKFRNAQTTEYGNQVSEHSADRINFKQNISRDKLTETEQQINQPECESTAACAELEVQLPRQVQQELSADIVAQVSEAYHFHGMVDYQHVLAVHADVAQRRKRKWAEVEPQFEKGGLMDVDQEDLMMLVPPLFSIKDVPEKVALKPSADLSSKKKQEGVVQHRWEMEIEPSLAIDFNIKDILIPKKVNWEKYIARDSDQWKWQTAVCELFDERPIWVKDSLAERLLDRGLTFKSDMLRRLLFRAAYYFSNGPFLRFWIRKGYDPRRDPESRIYQRIDFRVPPSLRSYDGANVASGSKHRWEGICAFRVFPYKSQNSLQLFELKDDYIQQEIRKLSSQTTCSLATGWFSSRVIDSLRLCVAVRFLSVYPKDGAESLLRSVSNRFEKSKRMHIYMKDTIVDEEGQQPNKVLDNESKEPNDDGEDEEDEDDENEDDNLGEEMDADEPFDLVSQERNFSLQPSTYAENENVSRVYLQELFGSFPFGVDHQQEDADAVADAHLTAGEYQIYDQYSDDNHSEDDDY
ncbi:Transcription factor IIIC [Abeliophyllum distichum]|uniref:Transcription factor IIIC n=1 Tax=Abeliophyllum distichum TaxID=126358 RepID=A0ABD1RBC1_9LAMI